MTTPQKEKTNQCTPEGQCLAGQDSLLCSFQADSILSRRCIYQVWESDKCLSPFALTAAREKAAA